MTKYLLLGILLIPTLAFSQTEQQKLEIRQELNNLFKNYTLPMTKAQQGEMLNNAAAKFPGWKLLGKVGGNNCPMPDKRLISCDYLVYGPTARGFDVIGSEGSIKASITGPRGLGGDVTPQIKSGSRTIEDPILNNIPNPPPNPPQVDLTEINKKLNTLESLIQNLVNTLNIERNIRESFDNQLNEKIDKIKIPEIPPQPIDCSVQFGLKCNLIY